jgi:3D (Asp-Asp-Asp) domain-containing protein
MVYGNGPRAPRWGAKDSRNRLTGMAVRCLTITAALLAVGALDAASEVVEPASPPSTAPPAQALPAQETTIFAGQTYQVVGDFYVDADGTYWRPLVVTTTAYSPTESQCDDTPGETATGSDARREYGIAADPRAVPYGTILRIPGYGDHPVDDTGGGMRRSWERGIVHLDLRIPLRRYDGHWRSEDEATSVAMQHGVRRDRIVLMKVPMPVTAAR